MIATTKDINSLKEDLFDLKSDLKMYYAELKLLKEDFKNIPNNTNLEIRIKELELWQSKLHNLMIDKTPANKEKLKPMFNHLRGKL